MDALSEEELPGARVVELAPVVALDSLDACAELGGGVGDKVSERVEGVRFEAQRKSPQIMSAIIKNDQIIFITRNADNWRGP
jgi:hypothetical protein